MAMRAHYTNLCVLTITTPTGPFVTCVRQHSDIPCEMTRLFGPNSSRIYTNVHVTVWQLAPLRVGIGVDWHRTDGYEWPHGQAKAYRTASQTTKAHREAQLNINAEDL